MDSEEQYRTSFPSLHYEDRSTEGEGVMGRSRIFQNRPPSVVPANYIGISTVRAIIANDEDNIGLNPAPLDGPWIAEQHLPFILHSKPDTPRFQ